MHPKESNLMNFELQSPFKPSEAQQDAIKNIAKGLKENHSQTLLGITGSGKTFVMANVIKEYQKPTLVLAHNKTLAAQLYAELKEFFPDNRVEYFISYFDYYQPESYMPTTDTYIEKDSSVNEQIERMRLRTMSSLLSRKDVIVVASISCIYGVGDPEHFTNLSVDITKGQKISRQDIIRKLIDIQYERNDQALEPGKFRVRGDTIDVIPAYEKDITRIELFGDEIDSLSKVHHITGVEIEKINEAIIFPAQQFVVPETVMNDAMESIKEELQERLPELQGIEQERLRKRVKYDLEMMQELGYCSGIENYSRHFEKRKEGEPPFVLLDYFPDDFLFIIDESHQTLPQARAMFNGDRARKQNLVDFGFRLPSALDNRPLKFNEFEKYLHHALFVSATPAEYELKHAKEITQLIIRPTGLLDPEIEIHPIEGQIKTLIKEINQRTERDERVLITTLTKRMAEDLTSFLAKEHINVRYMHSDIDSLDRIELIRQLRAGEFDVLVGINLLREGLDLPEVSLVAILDADKEGFLRDERSLIQTIGRAARNDKGKVILFADHETQSIKNAVKITKDRRAAQIAYNKEHNITPKTVIKSVPEKTRDIKGIKHMAKEDVHQKLIDLDTDMKKAAENLDFEKAIEIRDTITALKKQIE